MLLQQHSRDAAAETRSRTVCESLGVVDQVFASALAV